MPVGRSRVPLHDVRRRGVGQPDASGRRAHMRFNGDRHGLALQLCAQAVQVLLVGRLHNMADGLGHSRVVQRLRPVQARAGGGCLQPDAEREQRLADMAQHQLLVIHDAREHRLVGVDRAIRGYHVEDPAAAIPKLEDRKAVAEAGRPPPARQPSRIAHGRENGGGRSVEVANGGEGGPEGLRGFSRRIILAGKCDY